MSFQGVFIFFWKQGKTSLREETKPTAHMLCGTARGPQTGAGRVLALCPELLAAAMASHSRPRVFT